MEQIQLLPGRYPQFESFLPLLSRDIDASPMTTVTTPSDLLAAVPFLIGYQPSDSIVLISLEEESITMAIRIDFPESISEREASALVEKFRGSDGALLVSYIPDSCLDAESVIRPLIEAIDRAEIPLRESIIIVGNRWRSLVCPDTECCPLEGTPLPDLSDSRIAVEEIAQGKLMPFKNLDDMADSLSPDLDPVILEMIGRIPPINYEEEPTTAQREGANAILDFLHDFEVDRICRDKRLVAKVLVRLKDLQVRDFALGSMNDKSDLYFDAWRWLLKKAPNGFVAAPATLFAVAAYERGDGAMANLALDKAEVDQSSYSMVKLLRQLFQSGKPPTIFAELRAELHPKVCAALFSGSIPT